MATRPGQAAFEEQLERALRAYPAKAKYLIGVSGGRDSVALLHGLVALGYGRLVVAHLDHGLRGRAARADARFVARLADKLGLPADLERVDVASLARTSKRSVETAARDARHQFFFQAGVRHRCRTLFLAHHADDQVETFLFNLLRGAGPAGLAAMRVESRQCLGRRRLRIVRPLLGVWRPEIDEYLARHGLAWREDATNADTGAHTRNRLRAEILPALSQAMGRDVRLALWRAAEILGAEEDWIGGLLAGDPPLPARLPVARVRAEPVAKQRRLLRAWLDSRNATGVGFREVELVRGLLDTAADGPSKVNLPGDRHVRRQAGVLFVTR